MSDEMRECPDCGRRFPPQGGFEKCPVCRLRGLIPPPKPSSPALKDQVLELLRDPGVKAEVDGWLKERLETFTAALAERIRDEGPYVGWVNRPGSSGGSSIGHHLQHYLSDLGQTFGRAVREEMKE